jgi:hypothetical protein
MWMITQDEAVEMYARFLAARHGGSAGRLARKAAEKLQTEGDSEGHAIWSRVANAVEGRAKVEGVSKAAFCSDVLRL